MFNKVTITINSIEYTLVQDSNSKWVITNRAPLVSGNFPIQVTFYNTNGTTETITSDEVTGEMLMLLVENQITVSGNRMLDYYPEVIKCLLEFQALMFAEGFEVDFSKYDIEAALSDAYLQTMGEDRIVQWEQLLKITPSDNSTLENRRDAIVGRLRGNGKLNTKAINSIVSAFTKGTTESYFKDSTLTIKIKPPKNNKQYIFTDVENELQRRVPAHIALNVSRDYATWGEIKTNFASWQAIYNQTNWESINLYVAP